MTDPDARRLWRLFEPFHAVTYFAPEAEAAYAEVGLRGFWRGYFAGRAGPMGAVGPGVVTATFFGFAPPFVARALPSIWSMARPVEAVAARQEGATRALVRLFGPDGIETPAREAVELLRPALAALATAGRPLFAANLEQPWPQSPTTALWYATTLAREHRGDGHVAALVAAGLDGCQSHVSRLAATGEPPDRTQQVRGWDGDEWAAAVAALRQRGWLDDDGGLTRAGRAGRTAVEEDTDRLAAGLTARLGPEAVARLATLLGPLAGHLRDTGAVPYPNPIGVPPP